MADKKYLNVLLNIEDSCKKIDSMIDNKGCEVVSEYKIITDNNCIERFKKIKNEFIMSIFEFI
jgi:hypothetical protein